MHTGSSSIGTIIGRGKIISSHYTHTYLATPEERELPKPCPAFLVTPYSFRSNCGLLRINHTRQD